MVSALTSSTAPAQLMQAAQTSSAASSASTSSAPVTLAPDTVSISAAGRQMAQSSADADHDGD